MPDTNCHPNPIPGLRTLKAIDFELAYLALLTSEGLKPLSRWEKPLDERSLESLRRMDMVTKQIRRTVKTGSDVIETVFSRSPAYIDLYEKRFENTAVDKSAETQRFEGFLFGYPPCCIEQYIIEPYARNNLPEHEQKLLFHWACSNCAVTPLLLPAYERVYNRLNIIE
ncbi:MAG: hypothetical protein JW715_04120 [Sedimentisphaerales bacterium]|nr:hypothetical protein [Sedimentisphaerales bacterium]